jgi:hypothetical protein
MFRQEAREALTPANAHARTFAAILAIENGVHFPSVSNPPSACMPTLDAATVQPVNSRHRLPINSASGTRFRFFTTASV